MLHQKCLEKPNGTSLLSVQHLKLRVPSIILQKKVPSVQPFFVDVSKTSQSGVSTYVVLCPAMSKHLEVSKPPDSLKMGCPSNTGQRGSASSKTELKLISTFRFQSVWTLYFSNKIQFNFSGLCQLQAKLTAFFFSYKYVLSFGIIGIIFIISSLFKHIGYTTRLPVLFSWVERQDI